MQKIRSLRAPPQTPVPPAAGGFAPTPPKQPPQCEFLATPLLSVLVCYVRILPTSIRTAFSNIILTFATRARAAFQLLYISKAKAQN